MPQEISRDYSEEAELNELRQIAEEVFGIKFDKITHRGSEANLVGIRSEHMLVSRRLDSRTYFVQDSRYGTSLESGVFHGSDEEYCERCRGILKGIGVSLSEIGKEVVVTEQTQVARIDNKTKTVHKEEVQKGKQFAQLSRAVEKLPVWSSGTVLGLTREKTIGYLQLHWPELPTHVVDEAHRLAYKVGHDWKTPEQFGAGVEAVEAGIVHSPAIGFLMDIFAAIRVIYKPKDPRYGQKPVYFYDRHGKPVSTPRQVDMPSEATQRRHAGKRD
jgi:hypothetical protein